MDVPPKPTTIEKALKAFWYVSVAIVAFAAAVPNYLSFYGSTRPSPQTGAIYPILIHGSVVYGTYWQQCVSSNTAIFLLGGLIAVNLLLRINYLPSRRSDQITNEPAEQTTAETALSVLKYVITAALLIAVTVPAYMIAYSMLSSDKWYYLVESVGVAGFASAVMIRIILSSYYLKHRPTTPSPQSGFLHPYHIDRNKIVYLTEQEARFIGPTLRNIAIASCVLLPIGIFVNILAAAR